VSRSALDGRTFALAKPADADPHFGCMYMLVAPTFIVILVFDVPSLFDEKQYQKDYILRKLKERLGYIDQAILQ
jgi:hypothetical protein